MRLSKFLNNDEIMNSVEYGLLPNQTIYKEIDLKQIIIPQNKTNELHYIKQQIILNIHKTIHINSNNNLNETNTKEILSINNNDINYNLNIICYTNISKIEIIINNNLESEIYENIEEIVYLDYNKRLNMFIISSNDGYLYLYILPGKLINVIKHPTKNHFFNYVFLSSNPFPSIIAFDKIDNTFYSYSINGNFIYQKDLFQIINLKDDNSNINICPIFDMENGIYKD